MSQQSQMELMLTDQRYLNLIRKDCPLPPGAHVVAYCRDSGNEEQERSVRQQQAAIEEYCQTHQLVLERFYIDEARTGSESEKRDGLKAMMLDFAARFKQIRDLDKRRRYMEKNPFGLIVWKSNRLGRDSIETSLNKADMRIRGIQIVNLVPSIETGDPALDAMLEMVTQLQDERQLAEISENAQRGLAELVGMRDTDPAFLAQNPDWVSTGAYLGIMPGPPPRGFIGERICVGVRERKGKGNEKHYVQRLVPDPALWDRCKLAWQMRHEGEGIKAILEATKLYKSVPGYDSFFTNAIYMGDLHYGGRVYQNFVPAMIPCEWFEAEQERRAERARKMQGLKIDPMHEPRRVASRHLLTGLVYCGAVEGEEHPMLADTNPPSGKKTRWDHYMCSVKKNTRGAGCSASVVSARALDQTVIDGLMTHVLTVDNLRKVMTDIAERLDERSREIELRAGVAQSRLNEVEAAIAKLLDVIEAGSASAAIHTRLDERESEARVLRAQLAQIDAQRESTKMENELSDELLEGWVSAIRAALEGDDLDLARQAVRAFVHRIVVIGKVIKIAYAFTQITGQKHGLRGVTLSGRSSLPTYYGLTLALKRARRDYVYTESPARTQLRQRAAALRDQGLSYPEIAREIGVSQATAWNLLND